MTVCRPDLAAARAPCPAAEFADVDPGAEPEPESLQPPTVTATTTAPSTAIVRPDVVPDFRVTNSPGVVVGQ
jgi:hypothetical protein